MTLSHEPPRTKPRIESLTDLIFGLALSIGAVGLLNTKPANIATFLYGVVFFAFSFLILITIWFRYTDTMSFLTIETGRSRLSNVFLLFFVALEPYLFNIVAGSSPVSGNTATIAFAVDIGAIYASLASFNNILVSKRTNLIGPELTLRFRTFRNLQIVIGAIFWISTAPQFWALTFPLGGVQVQVRYVFWAVALVLSRAVRIAKRLG